ncbi:MAG: hypothetical protein ACE5NC_02540 [Anaerolineae bacterium]
MYGWLVFLHMFSVFVFLLVHGGGAAVMLKLRSEEDPEAGLALFNILPNVSLLRFLLALVIVTGLIPGFMLDWWREGWMWASLVVLALIALVHWRYGSGYLGSFVGAAERAIGEKNSKSALEDFAAVRATWHPIGVTAIGTAGLAIILWLMMFKPF